MTKREAEVVGWAAMEADGTCRYCCEDVLKVLNSGGLGWHWDIVDDDDDENEGWKVVPREVLQQAGQGAVG